MFFGTIMKDSDAVLKNTSKRISPGMKGRTYGGTSQQYGSSSR